MSSRPSGLPPHQVGPKWLSTRARNAPPTTNIGGWNSSKNPLYWITSGIPTGYGSTTNVQGRAAYTTPLFDLRPDFDDTVGPDANQSTPIQRETLLYINYTLNITVFSVERGSEYITPNLSIRSIPFGHATDPSEAYFNPANVGDVTIGGSPFPAFIGQPTDHTLEWNQAADTNRRLNVNLSFRPPGIRYWGLALVFDYSNAALPGAWPGQLFVSAAVN